MADGSVSDGAGDVDTNIPILDNPPPTPELGEQFSLARTATYISGSALSGWLLGVLRNVGIS